MRRWTPSRPTTGSRIPTPSSARDLVRLIETAVRTRIPAYLLVNNRAEGSAPLTVAEVARLLPGGRA